MSHFLDISQLSSEQAHQIIDRAFWFKNQTHYPNYASNSVANLFYENSTRTRVSFELAATHLHMPVVNLDLQHSSENKGEAIFDTVENLAAMGITHFVVRHVQERLPHKLAQQCRGSKIHIINAGDGIHAHPSQAMLDMMTVIEKKSDPRALKVAIVGDIAHSRVANSLQVLCRLMGVAELRLIAPSIWQPHTVHYGRVTDSIQEGLESADVVICLRVQRERIKASESYDLQTYRNLYAVNQRHLAYAQSDAIVLHPGPVNRGVELEDDIANGPQSVILDQVRNGVFMRMAILEWVLRNAGQPQQ